MWEGGFGTQCLFGDGVLAGACMLTVKVRIVLRAGFVSHNVWRCYLLCCLC